MRTFLVGQQDFYKGRTLKNNGTTEKKGAIYIYIYIYILLNLVEQGRDSTPPPLDVLNFLKKL